MPKKLFFIFAILNSYIFAFSQNLDLEDFRNNLESSFKSKQATFLINSKSLKNYYTKNNFSSYWIDENGLKPFTNDFLNIVKNDPVYKNKTDSMFKLNLLENMILALDKNSSDFNLNLLKIELFLTEIYDRYSYFLLNSSINWKFFQEKLKEKKALYDINAQWEKSISKLDRAELLNNASFNNSIDILKEPLDSNYKNYEKMSYFLEELEELEKNGDYIKLPKFKTLRLGDNSENVKFLRQRLAQSENISETCDSDIVVINSQKDITNSIDNLLDENQIESNNLKTFSCEEKFSDELNDAVKNFQRKHGLLADGIVGPATQRFLNLSAKDKIKQIRLNIERMRALKRDFGDEYILINIPEFNLEMYENSRKKLEMSVIVGEAKHPTPIFSDSMSYVVLNPYWNIPKSIVKKELIPKLLKDPNYLESQGIDIYTGWNKDDVKLDSQDIIDSLILAEGAGLENFKVAQTPGSKNPLGKMKFMFPNKHAVYLHDTPNKYLFKNARRAYSHGCVRLSEPNKLLEVLGNENKILENKKVVEILNEDKEKALNLNKKIPIHFIYLTSWVNDEGILQFREDIYGYDNLQKELMY